eukprot:TRINITY_DN486_c10_g1_i1.p1 TRINITY_DN486_c10_g1~~TRINITY_DN486_c10_g1_i1.p1  ORF type:complete len:314 (+),score=110.36 TRINITY_DN486_c10_g1_i1:263-1204(+)
MPRVSASPEKDSRYLARDEECSSDTDEMGLVKSARFRNACNLMAEALWELEKCSKDEVERRVLSLHFTPLERHVQDLLFVGQTEMERHPSPTVASTTSSQPVTPRESLCQRSGTRVDQRRPTQCICGKLLSDDFVSYYNEGLLGDLELERLQAYLKAHKLPVSSNMGEVLEAIIENMRKEWLEVEERQKNEVEKLEVADCGDTFSRSSTHSSIDVKELSSSQNKSSVPPKAPQRKGSAADMSRGASTKSAPGLARNSSVATGVASQPRRNSVSLNSSTKSIGTPSRGAAGSSAARRASQPTRPAAGSRAAAKK